MVLDIIVGAIKNRPQNHTEYMGIVNMNQHNKQAYARGYKAAGIWKQLKGSLVSWDHRCVTWARNHNAPLWVGRIPLIAAVTISLASLIAGSIAVALVIVFIWAMAFILQNIKLGNIPANESSDEDKKDLYDEFIMDNAINNEYDGAPYKSPSES